MTGFYRNSFGKNEPEMALFQRPSPRPYRFAHTAQLHPNPETATAMTKNPFPHHTSRAPFSFGAPGRVHTQHAAGVTPEPDPGNRAESGFLICVAITLSAFLLAMLFVFQEARHTRQIYWMGQEIVRAETEKRQSLEKERAQEVRNAELLAVLHSDHPLPHDPVVLNVSRAVAMR